MKAKSEGLARRKRRVRSKISGTADRPRLAVHRTNANIYASIVDDANNKILCSASTLDPELKKSIKVASNKEASEKVGELIGKRAKAKKISEVVFDRGGRIYHGRVKALAEGARNAGLKF